MGMPRQRTFCRQIALLFLFSKSACSFLLPTPVVRPTSALSVFRRLHRNKDVAGTELFRKGPYVPSGLSPEEYKVIKKEETDRLSKMNFAAFGPRFKQSDTPNGDWFLMPQLWIGGNPRAQSAVTAKATPDSSKNSGVSRRRKFGAFARQNGPALLLAYIVIDILIASAAVTRLQQMPLHKALLLSLRYTIFQKRAMINNFWKIHGFKLVASVALTPTAKRYLEMTKRRWSWSTFGATLKTTGVLLAIFASCALLGMQ